MSDPALAAPSAGQSAGAGKLRIESVSYRYWLEREQREFTAFENVSLDVNEGEFVCIVGPSGCGKTTLLNVAAGLLPCREGKLSVDGKPVNRPGVDRAMVFQHASLLPWRTVTGNVRYGMEMQRRFDSAAMDARAHRFIRLVGLESFEQRYPAELSGGMQQRVNLARALATDPEVLLMDEPFAALDVQTRELMQAELLKIWTESRKTVLFVTHQIEEAVFLADRVVVMGARPGRILRDVPVPFPRPRALPLKRETNFLQLCDQIWSTIAPQASSGGDMDRP